MTYMPPLDDIGFVLDEIVDLPGLAALPAFKHADPTSCGVLAEAGRFVAEVIAPLNRVGDRQHCHRNSDGSVTTPTGSARPIRNRSSRVGRRAVPLSLRRGWVPLDVAWPSRELMASASLAFSLCPMLTQGAIDLLVAYGSEQQKETYLPRMVTGEWTGTMDLTEPDAGSDWARCGPKPFPTGTDAGGSPVKKHSSPTASTTWPTTSSIWSWPECPTRRRGPGASRASSCRGVRPHRRPTGEATGWRASRSRTSSASTPVPPVCWTSTRPRATSSARPIRECGTCSP